MRIIDGLKLKGSPAEIPDCSRDNLPQFFVDLGYKVGAEIGVYKGEFTQKFCQAGLRIFAVDPWANQDQLYEQTKKTLAHFPGGTIIKKTSMEAVEHFTNESLDFVYIDANHEFRYIAEDLVEWTKRVKRGGIVSGHDYFYTRINRGTKRWDVAHVLNAFVAAYGITNWYLLGRKQVLPEEKRDKWRSWMFIRP